MRSERRPSSDFDGAVLEGRPDPMLSEEIRSREARERETFSKVAEGRSAVKTEDLLVPPAEIARYGAFVAGNAVPVYPIERLFTLAAPAPGKRILEICGHHGEYGAILAHLGAEVDSVDIAEPLVAMAKDRARVNNLEGKLRPAVMSVHEMQFPNDTFDVVFGKASLHHLDLRLARDEIHRVLKPGGYGVFSEPVHLMPIMGRLRAMVPIKADAESPDEKPLSQQDLDEFCRPFSRVEIFHFRLLQRLDRVLKGAGRLLARLDTRLLETVPALRPTAGGVLFRVFK
jgi:SAM-dependent methyltransferase